MAQDMNRPTPTSSFERIVPQVVVKRPVHLASQQPSNAQCRDTGSTDSLWLSHTTSVKGLNN
eukprot:6310930-Amphidinium_carterae.2